jgi:hypothetical protein
MAARKGSIGDRGVEQQALAYSPRAIGAGISDDWPPRGTPYPCSPLTPPPERSQSCAAQVVGEVVADTSDGE